jgi:hypothetical protein
MATNERGEVAVAIDSSELFDRWHNGEALRLQSCQKKLPSGWLRWKTSAERSKKKRIQPYNQGDHMPTFYLKISDGLEVQTPIGAPNPHEALSPALNALSQFACSHFPCQKKIVITVMDSGRRRLRG